MQSGADLAQSVWAVGRLTIAHSGREESDRRCCHLAYSPAHLHSQGASVGLQNRCHRTGLKQFQRLRRVNTSRINRQL